jgi:glyoxylase-like metal-dependent hydrolase (beta-lactamase superfamily II)
VSTPEPFEVHAIRYARMDRRASENFVGGDPHDGRMDMDYFVWVASNRHHRFVIDTGFNAATAKRRQREHLRCPTDGLNRLGIAASDVAHVVITHMHYDHAGNFDRFPKAEFHLQDREMAFATGRHMRHAHVRHAFDVDHVVGLVRAVHDERVRFHDGNAELAPGFTLHWLGGHTAGLQVARVWTKRGWIVLASDASHYYANMESGRPFPIVFNMGEMLEGYSTLRRLAETPAHIIPGHDPQVMTRYPAPRADLSGIVVRLDQDPTSS